jgi:hypothetical protein
VLTVKGDVFAFAAAIPCLSFFGKWRRALALNRGRRRLFATRKLRFRRQPKSIAKE